MMDQYGSRCQFTFLLFVAGYLCLADGVNAFRKCYNTSIEMHCFNVQYDATNRSLTTYFDNARQRCNALNSTLITIKDDDANNIVQNYMSDPFNPIRYQYIWTDAYRISDYNNSFTWHWLNSKLPNIPVSELSTPDYTWYVAALEFDTGKSQFHLTAQQPHVPNFANSYVCEYEASKCSSSGSNILQLANRCYISVRANVSWYEARNRCLQDGGDLASFANITNINFTSWLGSDPNVRFWIGLRFSWYIWKDSGEDVKFSKWLVNFQDWISPCLIVCFNCNPSFSWLPKDCNIGDSIYVVCHSVTSLQSTTLTTAPPVTTSVSITTQTVNIPPNNSSEKSDKLVEQSHLALGVGVGVGVGVPVIVAIIVIVTCVVRSHQSKTPSTSKTTRQGQREEASPTEVQTGKSEVSEINHYATIRQLSHPSSLELEKEPTSEAQYEILDFEEKTHRRNDNGQVPLSVL